VELIRFHDIVGKRVGYIGEFGKRIIDDLASLAGIDSSSYQTVRIGMNVVDAICRDVIDTGIGFINFQQVELEHLRGETVFLRIDQLAGLGCCCFCSIQFIVPERTLQSPELIQGFLNATQRGAAFTTEHPEAAYELLCEAKPHLRTPMYKTIFMRTLPFFSRSLLNVDRDWNKVGRYTRHLNIIDEAFDITQCYTNRFISETPYSDLKPIACCLEE
jgi:ABC-type nitrate/sulfonate/bicarbonate transport system substrate-binding protein